MVAYSNRGYSGIEGTLFSGGVDVNDGAEVCDAIAMSKATNDDDQKIK